MSVVNAELDVLREELARARSGGSREPSSLLASNPTETVQSVQDVAGAERDTFAAWLMEGADETVESLREACQAAPLNPKP